jgi:hypothetical protein
LNAEVSIEMRFSRRAAGCQAHHLFGVELLEERRLLAISFAPPVVDPVGTAPAAIAVGDFTGDGKPDVAVTTVVPAEGQSGQLSILHNRGGGTFAAPALFPGSGGDFIAAQEFAGNGRPTTSADVNGDGHAEIIEKAKGCTPRSQAPARFGFWAITSTAAGISHSDVWPASFGV